VTIEITTLSEFIVIDWVLMCIVVGDSSVFTP